MGKPGTKKTGTMLKKNRRVNTSSKYNPVFGHYGFLKLKDQEKRIVVNNKVTITKGDLECTI